MLGEHEAQQLPFGSEETCAGHHAQGTRIYSCWPHLSVTNRLIFIFISGDHRGGSVNVSFCYFGGIFIHEVHK